jgi:hypothetical protein
MLRGYHAQPRMGIYQQPGTSGLERPRPPLRLSEAEIARAEGKKQFAAATDSALEQTLALLEMVMK